MSLLRRERRLVSERDATSHRRSKRSGLGTPQVPSIQLSHSVLWSQQKLFLLLLYHRIGLRMLPERYSLVNLPQAPTYVLEIRLSCLESEKGLLKGLSPHGCRCYVWASTFFYQILSCVCTSGIWMYRAAAHALTHAEGFERSVLLVEGLVIQSAGEDAIPLGKHFLTERQLLFLFRTRQVSLASVVVCIILIFLSSSRYNCLSPLYLHSQYPSMW